MITAKCPLRVSLVGGSTDTDAFLERYGQGSVISFTPDIYTFITIHNSNTNRYIINYSVKESVSEIDEIKNDIVRECFKYFSTPYCTITFNSNIHSSGSGLASSSSYTISVIKAICLFQKIYMTDIEICNLAFKIEKIFNPLAGQQDVYGCGVSGFKRINFSLKKPHSYRFLDVSHIVEKYDMHLFNTGIVRNSTDILKTLNVEKSYGLLKLVDAFEDSIVRKDSEMFFNIFNEGWQIKKTTSQEIMNNQKLMEMDNYISSLKCVKGYKLCGAGGGGYYLIFSQKNSNFSSNIKQKFINNSLINVNIDSGGVKGNQI